MALQVQVFLLIGSLNIFKCGPVQIQSEEERNEAANLQVLTRTPFMREEALINLACDLFVEKKFDEALHCFNKALEINPHKAWFHKFRGDCHQVMGKSDAALQDFRRAVLLDQYNSEYRMLLCDTFYASGRFNEAKEEKALLPPDFVMFGDKLCALEKFEDAILSYTWAIEAFPTEEYYRSRGYCYVKMGNKDDMALSDFEKVAEKDGRVPNEKKVGHARVLLWLAMFDFDRADDVLKELHTFDEFQLTIFGDEFSVRKKFDMAATFYSEAQKKRPENAEILMKRGLVYWQMTKYDRAILDFAKAAYLVPSLIDSWINLAGVIIDSGKYADGKKMLEGLEKKYAYSLTYTDNLRIRKVLSRVTGKGNVFLENRSMEYQMAIQKENEMFSTSSSYTKSTELLVKDKGKKQEMRRCGYFAI